jgi:hypothetical protein
MLLEVGSLAFSHEDGLRQVDWHNCRDATGDRRCNSIWAFAGQRMEAVASRHAAAVMLSANAAAKRCRRITLRQRRDHAGEQKQ